MPRLTALQAKEQSRKDQLRYQIWFFSGLKRGEVISHLLNVIISVSPQLLTYYTIDFPQLLLIPASLLWHSNERQIWNSLYIEGLFRPSAACHFRWNRRSTLSWVRQSTLNFFAGKTNPKRLMAMEFSLPAYIARLPLHFPLVPGSRQTQWSWKCSQTATFPGYYQKTSGFSRHEIFRSLSLQYRKQIFPFTINQSR